MTRNAVIGKPGDTLVSFGCDYITALGAADRRIGGLAATASAIYHTQAERGEKTRGWSMSGFRGWQCGSVQVGVRDKLCMVRLSSDSAHGNWSRIAALADNVTRLDIQATVQTRLSPTRVISLCRSAATKNALDHKDNRLVRWVCDNRGGYTLYLGSRKSKVFGRIYDKGAESGSPSLQGTVRFEAQFQDELAWSIASAMRSVALVMPRFCSYLSQFFSGRGVILELPLGDEATYCCSRNSGTVETNLAWLESSVRPTVMRLIALGRGEDVLRALGLVQDIGTESNGVESSRN